MQGSLTEGERISTINLLILTSLDQLLLIMKILFKCFTRQAILMRRSIVLSLPLQLVVPGKWASPSHALLSNIRLRCEGTSAAENWSVGDVGYVGDEEKNFYNIGSRPRSCLPSSWSSWSACSGKFVGALTLGMMTLCMMTLGITTLGNNTLGNNTLGMMTLSIMTLSITTNMQHSA